MHFLSPLFLFALFALAIPLIVHLFNFRKFRKVYFSNVRFLKELQQKTKRQSELKHFLVMLARMLAIAALVFAFARPYFPLNGVVYEGSSDSYVSIYLDNSFSMDAQGSEGLLLDVAKTKALAIAASYQPSDWFHLITNDFEGRHQQFVSREEFVEMLNEVVPSAISRPMSEVYRRQTDLLAQKKQGKHFVYMLSDYQKTTADLANMPSDSGLSVFHLPLKAVSTANVYVDSCWFETPFFRTGQQLKLHARIFNASEDKAEKLPVKLIINDAQRTVASIDVEPWASAEAVLTYTSAGEGIQKGMIEIMDYPLTYDDTFFLSYKVSSSSELLVLSGKEPSSAFKALFRNDSAFVVTYMPLSAINYGLFSSHSLIILDGLQEISSGLEAELLRYLAAGGNIFVIPSEKPDFESYNRFLTRLEMPLLEALDTSASRLSFVDIQHSLFRDVFEADMLQRFSGERIDLPLVRRHFRVSAGSRSKAQTLIKLESEAPFLLSRHSGMGNIYMMPLSLSPSFSNLTRHSLFVIIMYRIALLSDRLSQLYLIPGKYEEYFIPDGRLPGDKVYRLKSIDGSIEVIPSVQRTESGAAIGLQGQLNKAGNYLLYKSDSLLSAVAVNYDRYESDLRAFNAEDIKIILKDAGLSHHQIIDSARSDFAKNLMAITNARFVWKWFLLLALFFLAVEVALIRLWK